MLTLAEVAVADAVPAVIDTSDVLATAPGPQEVLEILKQYPLGGKFLDIPLKRERPKETFADFESCRALYRSAVIGPPSLLRPPWYRFLTKEACR